MTISYLAEFRKALNLTQEELAKKSGLSVDTIRRYEKEGMSDKILSTSQYLYSKALGCSVDVVWHFNKLQKKED